MRKTILAAIAVAILAVGGSWIYSQPGKAYLAVKTAMDRDDPAMLAPHVDFAALRANIKNRAAAKLPPELSSDATGLLGMLGSAMKDMVLGTVAESMSTPQGVLAMLRGAAAGQGMGEPAPAPATPSERLFANAHSKLLDLRRFVVNAPLRDGTTLQLLFTREGTVWKLSDIAVMQQPEGTI